MKKIKVVTGIILILFIAIICWFNYVPKNNPISYDNWLLFYGTIIGAIITGGIAAVGIYKASVENNKSYMEVVNERKLQYLNEEINSYFNYRKEIGELYGKACLFNKLSKDGDIKNLKLTELAKLYVEVTTISTEVMNKMRLVYSEDYFEEINKEIETLRRLTKEVASVDNYPNVLSATWDKELDECTEQLKQTYVKTGTHLEKLKRKKSKILEQYLNIES